jgi:hypothetical protein
MYKKACAVFSDETITEIGEGLTLLAGRLLSMRSRACSSLIVVSMLPLCSWYKSLLLYLDACGLFKSSLGVAVTIAEQRYGGEEKEREGGR